MNRTIQLGIIYQRSQGLTDGQFAEKLGVSRQTWSRVKTSGEATNKFLTKLLEFVDDWMGA